MSKTGKGRDGPSSGTRKGLLPSGRDSAGKRKGLLPAVNQASGVADLKSALRVRLSTAIESLVEVTPSESAFKFLSERTDVDALIGFVSQNSVAVSSAALAEDPLRAAKSRAAAKMATLMAAGGGPWGVERVAEHLGVSRAAVDKRRRTQGLIGIIDGARAVKYPSWQFTSTGTIPGLEDVLRKMAVQDPWMRIQFFLTPDVDLEATPLEALKRGRIEAVIEAAERYGREGEDA